MKNNPYYQMAFDLAVRIGDETNADTRRRLVGEWSAAMAQYLKTTDLVRSAHV